jgi:hypothetical protein
MKKLSLLILTVALVVPFMNCQKRGFIPETPTSVSSKRTSSPKDTLKNSKRSIFKPDSLTNKKN